MSECSTIIYHRLDNITSRKIKVKNEYNRQCVTVGANRPRIMHIVSTLLHRDGIYRVLIIYRNLLSLVILAHFMIFTMF